MKNTVYIEVIRQLSDLLKQLSPYEYTKSLCVLNGSSIRQHTRHVVEFHQCLLAGKSDGIVDYDGRERNLLLENDLNFTIEALEKIKNSVVSIKNPSETILLSVSYCTNNQYFIKTNFLREMVYLLEHSIHHYALIRIGLQQNFSNITIPKNFGIAFSTIRHHEMTA